MSKKLTLSLILGLLCIIIASVFFIPSTNALNKDFKYSLDKVNSKLDSYDDNALVEIADEIINGELHVSYNIDESLPYELASLDWNISYTDSPNTFQLYLQALNPIVTLSRAYSLTNDNRYLEYARKILESWITYEGNKKLSGKNPLVWHDHGTALRTENLIYFCCTLEKAGMLDDELQTRLYDLLVRHGEYLANDKHYTDNHNHGIMQDCALIRLSAFLGDNYADWMELAYERLMKQKEFAFNSEMVHVENSPGYAIGTINYFLLISQFMISLGYGYG